MVAWGVFGNPRFWWQSLRTEFIVKLGFNTPSACDCVVYWVCWVRWDIRFFRSSDFPLFGRSSCL